MTRRRWRITLLAALATLAAIYPITSLFTASTWLPEALLVIALVRRARPRRPRPDALARARRGRSRCSSPATCARPLRRRHLHPAGPDTATVEAGQLTRPAGPRDHPALLGAGAAQRRRHLLSRSSPSRSSRSRSTPWRPPGAARRPPDCRCSRHTSSRRPTGRPRSRCASSSCRSSLWLVMLHTTARAQFGRWGTANAADESEIDEAAHDRDALRSFTAGRSSSAPLGVVVALLVPAVIPHFPPRYLTEGLGRSGGGAGEGSVGFNDTLDLSRSLNNQDQSPVLTYTTTAFTRAPLRVLATSYYSRGQWRVAGTTGDRARQPVSPAAAGQTARLRHHRHGQHPRRAAHRGALPRRRRRDGGHAVDDRPRHPRRAGRPRRRAATA